MIAKLAKSTAHFFYEKNIVSGGDEEIYAYGMELLYSSVFNILLAVVIAAATDTLLPSTVFIITFIVLRQYIGGYHADTHIGCMLILAVVLITFGMLSKYIPTGLEIPISISSTVISIILVILFAPVEHPNKPLSDNDKIRLRKNGIIGIFMISVIIIIMILFDVARRYGMYIAMGMFTSSYAMLCGAIKNKRKWFKNEQ